MGRRPPHEISAAFYGPLQALEILVRNPLHRELSKVYGTTWYDDPGVPLGKKGESGELDGA